MQAAAAPVRATVGGSVGRDPRVTDALAVLAVGRLRACLDVAEGLEGAPGLGATDEVLRRAMVVDVMLARGALSAAVHAAGPLAPSGTGLAAAVAGHVRARVEMAQGAVEAAEAALTAARALGLDDAPGDLTALVPWPATEALLLVKVGRPREALEVALAWLERARTPYERVYALRTLAGVEPGGRRVALLREAQAVLEGMVAERLAAQVETDLAGLLVLGGQDDAEALALLRAAERYAGREDLAPLQSRVRWLLGRLGEEPAPTPSGARATLTAAEHRVARLAARGLSNREIAGQLQVGTKAVEWHLSHVYRKLGTTRRELSDALGFLR